MNLGVYCLRKEASLFLRAFDFLGRRIDQHVGLFLRTASELPSYAVGADEKNRS